MTFVFYNKRPYIEYVAISLVDHMQGDIDANNVQQIRAGLSREWDSSRELIQIRNSMTNIPGYVGMDRPKGLYYWIGRDGKCRTFDPRTGKLGKVMKLPQRDRKLIYDEETWEIKKGYRKNRTVRRL